MQDMPVAAAFEPDIGHLLQQLHDIHPAAEPSWWPPAPGWWLLAALLLALLAYGVHRWRVRQRRLAPLRAAERELSAALQNGCRPTWRAGTMHTPPTPCSVGYWGFCGRRSMPGSPEPHGNAR